MSVIDIFSEILKTKPRLSRLFMSLVMIMGLVLVLLTLVFNEIKKQDISKSQLEIEKNRVTLIDKQLSDFYSKTYSNNDSLSAKQEYDKIYLLKQIDFLKKQREDAVKNIDNINKNPDPQILIFTLLAALLTIFLLMFFTNSFKSNYISQNDRIEHIKKRKQNSDSFLTWITSSEIAQKNLAELDLDKARSLKEIYDLSEKLGDERSDFLNLIIHFTSLKRKQEEIRNDKHSQIFSIFENIQERLKEECNRLNKQAIINLFLCFFIAFILMSYITYTSVVPQNTLNNISGGDIFIVKYLPRIIAVTSFLTMFLYFVKLYKTNIVDVKYYQNELTNVELKQTSLKSALITNDNDLIKSVTMNLNITERNAILTKEQTSIEIERIRVENEINKDYLNKVWDLLSINKSTDNKS
jgi:cell division protein FtsB